MKCQSLVIKLAVIRIIILLIGKISSKTNQLEPSQPSQPRLPRNASHVRQRRKARNPRNARNPRRPRLPRRRKKVVVISGDSIFKIMALSLFFVLGFIGMAVVLVVGLLIFQSATSLTPEPEREMIPSSWTFLIFVPITIVFLLPLLIIFGLDILSPIKKILIYFGLMTGLVKMRKIND